MQMALEPRKSWASEEVEDTNNVEAIEEQKVESEEPQIMTSSLSQGTYGVKNDAPPIVTLAIILGLILTSGTVGWFSNSIILAPKFETLKAEFSKNNQNIEGEYVAEMQFVCPDSAKSPKACRSLFSDLKKQWMKDESEKEKTTISSVRASVQEP
jgi:hypothetical protein